MSTLKKPLFKYPDVESQLLKRNVELLPQLLEWMYQTPTTTTFRLNLLKTTFEEIKNKIKRDIQKKYGIDPKIYPVTEIPEVLCLKDIPYQRTFENIKEVIVDSRCGAAILRGSHLFAPGVLGMQSGTKLEEKVNVFSDTEGKCKKGTNVRLELAHREFLGIGTVKMQRYQLYGNNLQPRGIAIEMDYTTSGVPSLSDNLFIDNEVLLQNFPSIVCSRVLDPKPGESVLDMCASPGHKTLHIVELMQNEGDMFALDKTEKKVAALNETLLRIPGNKVKIFAFDSTKAVDKNGQDDRPPFSPERFDKILLDAPCSGLGNRPVLSSELNSKMLSSYPPLQKKLFNVAVQLLKSKGTLVYSTCTVTEEENEVIVSWALEKFPFLKLVEAKPFYGSSGLKNCGLNEDERKLVQRFGPFDEKYKIDSVGFFIAKFIKLI